MWGQQLDLKIVPPSNLPLSWFWGQRLPTVGLAFFFSLVCFILELDQSVAQHYGQDLQEKHQGDNSGDTASPGLHVEGELVATAAVVEYTAHV